jgi:uncharacterized membrane protein
MRMRRRRRRKANNNMIKANEKHFLAVRFLRSDINILSLVFVWLHFQNTLTRKSSGDHYVAASFFVSNMYKKRGKNTQYIHNTENRISIQLICILGVA